MEHLIMLNREKILSYLRSKAEENDPFKEASAKPDPYYQMPEIADDEEWILHLYHSILDRKEVDKNDEGFKYWQSNINKNFNRQQIEQYFRETAFKTLQQIGGKSAKFEDFLDPKDHGRVLVVMPEGASEIYLITSLFASIKERYPHYALYVATKPQFKSIIDGNTLVDHWLAYIPIMDNTFWLEGQGGHKGYFDVAYTPHLNAQKLVNYTHNGKDFLDFNLKK
jgi:hypothetical protein